MKALPLRTTTKVIALFTHSLLNRSSPLITSTSTAFRPSHLTTATSTLLATSANNYYCSASNSTIVNQTSLAAINATKLQQYNNSTNSINRKMSAVQSMARGHNGRIEEAFAQAKERGEAAFVTFVTAGFPEKDGESIHCYYFHVVSQFASGCYMHIMCVLLIHVIMHLCSSSLCSLRHRLSITTPRLLFNTLIHQTPPPFSWPCKREEPPSSNSESPTPTPKPTEPPSNKQIR